MYTEKEIVRKVYFAKCNYCGRESSPVANAGDVAMAKEIIAWDWFTGGNEETIHCCDRCLKNPKTRQSFREFVESCNSSARA